MASRKLKFKPKPVVGGGVRRLREKEEVLVPEITIKEPNAEKELTFGNVSQIDTKKEQLSIENINEENVSKKARLEQSEKEQENVLMNSDVKLNNLDGSPSKGVSESADKMIIETSSQVTSNTIIPSSAQIEEMTHSGISISEGLESTPMDKSENNTSCLADSLSNDKELCVETDLTLNNEKNSVLNSHPSKETSVDSKPMDKSDAGKAYRFGRSKFKPVLNNAATRKKAEIGDDQVTNKNNHSEVYPVGMVVRTESVIKCVKSETRRPSIVDEIAESFSSLESDEIGEPPISNSVQVTAEALVYRFDYGNEDVNNSLSEPDTTKRVTHVAPPKSKDLLDKAKSVSEIIVALSGKSELGSNSTGQTRSNQKLDSNLQCESVNINNQPAVTNKVPTSQCESVNINNQPAVTNKVPTSPLKPSSKMLVPKPSPNLLDMAARRISFHGSDSEEDSKRKIFLKNDHLGKKEKKEKDIKNNKRKISQGSTYSKLGQEALEKFTQKFGKVEKLDAPDKSKLTMLDLIFYNPKSNPMSMSSDKPTGGRKKENKFEVSGMLGEKLVEESVDDVEEPAPAVPVPQLKIGPDGQIMLDPKSLIIETTEVKEKRAEMEKSAVIRETGITRYNTYSKKKHSRRDWTAQETLQFYKALNTIGSDFTLMTKLFPKRSRHELKLKFKKEEKTNMKLIDKAMTAPADFDFSSLEEEMKRENEEIARIAEEKRLAAEAAREARALKKEEKKKKGDKKYRYPNYLRVRDAAFRNFDESEVKVMETLTERKKRRKNKKRKSAQYVSSSDDEVEITNIDLDSKESEEVERDLLKITNKIMIPGIRRGRRVRKTRKLEECEEINETLKRKLQEMESNSNDCYTPNGPEADMLFGSPARDPFSDHLSQDAEESQWSMEVTSVPSVENSVLVNNIEDVSELSELGSFGQNDDVLDLSLPERINSRSETAQGGSPSDGVLNRHLISQSIQIIDELTSDQHLNAEENITLERKSADENPFINDSNKEEQSENRIPLPSFESVSSRLPVIYSVQDQYVSAQSDENTATTHQGGNSPSTPVESHPNSGEHVSNDKGIVVSYYCNNSEECILGD